MVLRVGIVIVVALLATGLLLYSQHRHEKLHVSGLIEAYEIRVGSRVGGRIAKVPAEEGAVVKTGDELVELEPFDLLERRAQAQADLASKQANYERLKAGFRPEEIAEAKARAAQLAARLEELKNGPRPQEIAAAEAQVRAAQAELDVAQSIFNRIKPAVEQKAASAEQLDRASQELKVAQQTLQVRRQELALLKAGTRAEQIAQAEAALNEAVAARELAEKGYRAEDTAQAKASVDEATAAVATIEKQMQELTVHAPVNGLIESVDIRPGDLVAANAPALSMLDTSTLWVRAYVPENHLNLQVGQKFAITVDSFANRNFTGHVTFIARQAEFTPNNAQTPEERSKQVFRIKVTLDDGLDLLRPGMAADVWLE
jgi:multidrug resistance efflux pump